MTGWIFIPQNIFEIIDLVLDSKLGMVELGVEARGSEVEAQLVNREVNPVCKCEDEHAQELWLPGRTRKELLALH